MLQDKTHYSCLLKYACRPYKNQKQRKENNHKLNCNNNNISSKYNQGTMFPVKRKCDTWFSLCPIHLHLKTMLSCFGSLKVAFHWDYIHSHYWTFSVHQYNRKINTRLHTLEGHLCIQELNIKLKAVVINNRMKKKWTKPIKGSLYIKFIKQDKWNYKYNSKIK